MQWHSYKTDLIYHTYLLYKEGTVQDKYGRPVTFKWLIERVCKIVGTSVPKNPHQFIAQARMRKGIKGSPKAPTNAHGLSPRPP